MPRLRDVLFPRPLALPLPSELLLLAARLFTGLGLALGHGLAKLPPSGRFVEGVAGMGFPAPELFAWLAALSEFGGGLAIAAGLLVRPAAVLAGVTMAVAAFLRKAGLPFGERELPLAYLALLAMLAATGGGRLALDRLLARRG